MVFDRKLPLFKYMGESRNVHKFETNIKCFYVLASNQIHLSPGLKKIQLIKVGLGQHMPGWTFCPPSPPKIRFGSCITLFTKNYKHIFFQNAFPAALFPQGQAML